MSSEATFIILFSIATGVAIAVRNLRVPYTVALVVVGLTMGAFHIMEAPHLTRELLFAVFLPGLLFDAAFNIEAKEFWRNRLAVGALAVPGVLVGIILTGLIVTAAIQAFGLVEGFGWRHGLVFGALVAATDPIAVVGLFRELNAPNRLRVLVEGESLLNDGTSIVALTLILAYVSGVSTSANDLIVQFTTIVGGGALVGAVLGFGLSRIIARIDDAMIEITLTTIAAYGSFVLSEQLHYSGVIATVTAGLICGSYGRSVGMSPSTKLAVQTFWEYVAFALNSVIFLLIGFEVGFGVLAASWTLIAIAFLAVIASRSALILAVTALLRRTHERFPVSWGVALTWAGLRGALSMVLALALAADFPGRQLLVTMTFGVVLLSILLQGLTMSTVLRKLGIVTTEQTRFTYDLARGRLQVSAAVVSEVERMRTTQAAPPDVLDRIGENYMKRGERARDELRALHGARSDLREEAASAAVEHLLRLEKAELQERLRAGLMRRDVFDHLVSDVDERLVRLTAGRFDTVDDVLPFTDEWEMINAAASSSGDSPDEVSPRDSSPSDDSPAAG